MAHLMSFLILLSVMMMVVVVNTRPDSECEGLEYNSLTHSCRVLDPSLPLMYDYDYCDGETGWKGVGDERYYYCLEERKSKREALDIPMPHKRERSKF